MKLTLTKYKDSLAGVFPEGEPITIDAKEMSIGGRGYINIVDTHDVEIDFNKPFKEVTEIVLSEGRKIFVSETKAEIEVLMATELSTTTGLQTQEFEIAGDGVALPAIPATVDEVDWPAIIPDNAEIHFVFVGGVPVNNKDLVFTGTRTVDFTEIGGLPDTTPKTILKVSWKKT